MGRKKYSKEFKAQVALDAQDGYRVNCSQTEYEPTRQGSQDVSVSAQGA